MTASKADTWAGHILTLVAVVAVTFVGYYKADVKYVETHNALCSFKFDLERRHTNGTKFVAEIEAGKRRAIPGIPITELHRSLANQRSTLDALASLDC